MTFHSNAAPPTPDERKDLYQKDKEWLKRVEHEMEKEEGEIKFCKTCGEKFLTKYGYINCDSCREKNRLKHDQYERKRKGKK